MPEYDFHQLSPDDLEVLTRDLLNRPGIAGGIFVCILCRALDHLKLVIESFLGLGRRDIADGREQAAVVEPVHPFQCRPFHVLQAGPRPLSVDHFSLV